MTRDTTLRGTRGATLLAIVALAGCASGSGSPRSDDASPGRSPPPGEAPASLAPAPWSAAPLDADDVPGAYLDAWNAAENRASCALIAPASIDRTEATPRRATFGGGWGVAYDLHDLRSAFGVAGTGAPASGDTYDDWPHRVEWADGSTAGYGPEGGVGPNQLAYVVIPGQSCLYNVWSRLGVEHLESLLDRLRFVR